MNQIPPHSVDHLLEHQSWLRGLARRLVTNEAQADDLVQQAWLAALRSPPRKGPGVRAWLATVLRNAASKAQRKDESRGRREAMAAQPEGVDDTVALAAEVEAQRELAAAVLRLDEPYRSVVLLRFFRDLKPGEIARQTDVKLATVKTRLHRGLQRLRKELDLSRGGDRRAWCLALLPLATRSQLTPSTSLLSGALVLNTTTKTLAAGVLLATSLGLGWSFLSGDPQAEGPEELNDSLHPRFALVPEQPGPENIAAIHPKPLLRPPRKLPAPELAVVLRICDGEGKPAANAQLVFLRKDGRASRAEADENGECRLVADSSSVEAFVLWDGAPPHREAIELKAGVREMRLPLGSVVGGRVLVAGAAPGKAIPLRLQAPMPFPSGEGFPPAVIDLLEDWGTGPSVLNSRSDAEGNFRFTGLSPHFRGQLRIPGEQYLREQPAGTDTQSLEIPAPRPDYVLRLRSRPSLRGRVLTPDGQPAAGGFARLNTSSPGGGGSRRQKLNGQGVFEFFLSRRQFTEVELILADGSGIHRRKLQIEDDISSGRDLGDLRLEGPRQLNFQAVDEQGNPLSGVRAHTPGDARNPSLPTGANGRGHYAVTSSDRGFWFAAPGYEIKALEIPRNLESPSVVQLSPATRLDLRIEDEGGEASSGVTLLVSASRPFLGDPGGFASLPRSPEPLNPKLISGSWGGEVDMKLEFELRGGQLRIERLLPDIPLKISVLDPMKRRLASKTVTLKRAETRQATLVIPRPGGSFRGRVLDGDGHPLNRAMVFVSIDGRREQAVSTDAFGAFVAPPLRADRIRVLVRRRGFLSAVVEQLNLPKEGIVRDFHLIPATDLNCVVTDALGRPIEGAEISAASDDRARRLMGMRLVSETDRRGRAQLQDLPEGIVRIRVQVAGRSYQFSKDARAAKASLIIPAHGGLRVRFDHPFHRPITEHRLRYLPKSGGSDIIDDTITVAPDLPAMDHTTQALLPGRYEVILERLSDQDWQSYLPVATQADVVVKAGSTVTIHLVPTDG